jgi:hypothetical protein
MTDLDVSPEYLASLSNRMNTWVTDNLTPAVAAVPTEWTMDSTLVASAAGSALIGAAGGAIVNFDSLTTGYDEFVKRGFEFDFDTSSNVDFNGAEAMQGGWILKDFYSIATLLASGDYWGAALEAIGMIPRYVSIIQERDGTKALFDSTGGTTAILDYTGYALTGLGYCVGLGVDDQKEVFTDGAKRFDDGGAAMRQLMPGSDWQGSASTGYGEVVTQLGKLMSDMAAADVRIAEILQAEEDQLQVTRNVISAAQNALTFAVPIAIAIYVNPELGGPPASTAYQAKFAAATFASVVGAIGNQLRLSYTNGEQVHAEKEKYTRVLNEAGGLQRRLSA